MSPLRPNDFEIQNRHPAYIFKNMRYCSNSQQVKPAPSAISRQCPQCRLHILSACQRTQIRNMITERLNLACRMTFKAVSKTGSLGSCVVSMDIGSNERMTMRNLQISETAESRIIPKWIFPPWVTPLLRLRQIYLQPPKFCAGYFHRCKNTKTTN